MSELQNFKDESDIVYEGQIIHMELESSIVIDAQPHVMTRIREIFPQSKNASRFVSYDLKYTHRPLQLPINRNSCKEVYWLMQRYNFELTDSLLEKIKELSEEYDKIRKNLSNGLSNVLMINNNEFLKLNETLKPEPFQVAVENFIYNHSKRFLLADPMGLGKTLSSSLIWRNPEYRKVIFVCKPTLKTQHYEELKMYYPDLKEEIIYGRKNYDLKPDTELVVIPYHLLQYWDDFLIKYFNYKTLIFDEVSELRTIDTKKREAARALSKNAVCCIGADGNPIWNKGTDIYSIVDVISPKSLGDLDKFKKEWCDYSDNVMEPVILNQYLKNEGLMIRRTFEEAGRKRGELYSNVYHLDNDSSERDNEGFINLAKALLRGNVGSSEYAEAVSQFDFKLRQETGRIKAPLVAEFVTQLSQEVGKVLLIGWHHDVYDIWKKELAQLNPVFITGKEKEHEKDAAKKRFIEDESCKALVISLRSTAGLNGLQTVCNNIVFGELDWANAAHEQAIFRLLRIHQTKPVNAYYLVLNELSDPFMVERLNIKRAQHVGVVEGKDEDVQFIESSNNQDHLKKLREMARKLLIDNKVEFEESLELDSFSRSVTDICSSVKVTSVKEADLQHGLFNILKEKLPQYKIEREVKISKKSRLDFLISNGEDKVIIECKNTTKNRNDAIKQARRYIEELKPKCLILFVPWSGGYDFMVDDVPVVIISYSKNL